MMGVYLNPGNENFFRVINSQIYVDKTCLIGHANKVLNTLQRFVCVTRPRRFGKSIDVNMLAAYYSRGCDSKELFSSFKIAADNNFERYRNKFDTIFLNMQEFLSQSQSIDEMIELLENAVLRELFETYPDGDYFDDKDLAHTIQEIYKITKIPFVIIIDEWDCVFWELKEDKEAQKRYLKFLCYLLKDRSYVHLAYMTGILPIRKFGVYYDLNMFDEWSMITPGCFAEFVGFTEKEVKKLCKQYGRDFSEMTECYGGYRFNKSDSMHNPELVVQAVTRGSCGTYWNKSEAFKVLKMYSELPVEGLEKCILDIINGKSVYIEMGHFTNDVTTFWSKDSVLTLLVHLGYLGYDFDEKYVFIPNEEVRKEFMRAYEEISVNVNLL